MAALANDVKLGAAVEVTVLERRDDGSGLVELPILPVSEIDMSRTAGGGKGKVTIRVEELDQIVSNFRDYGAPVPVGFLGHEEDRSGPQPVFIEAVKRRGEMLWATMDLNAWAFDLVVTERAFRAFSVEIQRDLKTATAEFEGWVLTGGTFTNRPATQVNFRVAAEGETESQAVAVARQALKGEESGMSDKDEAHGATDNVTLTFHNQKVAELKAELEANKASRAQNEQWLQAAKEESAKLKADLVALSETAESLTVERDSERAKAARLEVQHRDAITAKKHLETALNEQTEKLHESESAHLAVQVREVVTQAIDAGVPPAIFDGYEADPAQWMQTKYASFEAFQNTVEAIRGVGVKLGSAHKSGHDPAKAAEPKDDIPDEHKAVLSRIGLDKVSFTGVTTEAEARKRWVEAHAKKE